MRSNGSVIVTASNPKTWTAVSVHAWYWVEHVQGAGSTSAKASRLLSRIHFGPNLQTRNAPQLKFHCGEVMGDCSSWVTAQDESSLSLLQARLIDLKMPIKVVEGERRW